ncbi:hypothetical protein Goari_001113, partial [Gossypium aridum]|nr:hypothetical protein [Gossypium aridum]
TETHLRSRSTIRPDVGPQTHRHRLRLVPFEAPSLHIVDITAIYKVSRSLFHVRAVRRKGCVIESNPSPHGGRGALPSEGGSPSDLLFLAGGGIDF